MPPTSRGSRGFTLLESLVVLFLLSVTAAVAYPGMQSWLTGFRESAELRAVIASFQQARAEAARRNCDVVLSFTEGTSGESGERGSYQMVAEPAAGMPIPLGAPRRFEALFLQKSKDRLGFNFRGMPANSSGSLELTDHRGRVRSIAMSKYGRVALK